tara:strand:+ start:387 stop:1088 length:702 start_codon:yes stop_codon:yes gene_type:complete
MLLILAIITIIGIMIYFINESQKFNPTAELIQLQDPNKTIIQENIKSKSPLLIHNLLNNDISDFSFEKIVIDNPGYIIKDNQKNISLSIFNDKNIKQVYILDNPHLIDDFKLKDSFKTMEDTFSDDLTFNLKTKMNLFKGDHKVNIQKNKHNNLIISQLYGETIFYIINPKHSEIINKNYNEIKKWSIKIILKQGLNLYIPPEWFYIYEVQKNSIFANTYSDNYFTFLYNYLR